VKNDGAFAKPSSGMIHADQTCGLLPSYKTNKGNILNRDLLSINEAVNQGIDRIRKAIWRHPMDHFKLDFYDGGKGPWGHLYSPMNKGCNGRDPVDILIMMFEGEEMDTKEWLPYEGALPDSPEYKEEEKVFCAAFGKHLEGA